ncbi:MAG TPA: ABC transporter ATP-binding protein [Stellaceae bacterium]|nr:ABC transporter ATP-binding protein [Stellaceae bacterium]
MSALLEVDDLRVRFGALEAVKGVSFAMGRERLGLVGASGAGKSLIGRALLRLTPPGAATSARRIVFDGIDIATADARRMRGLRGRRIGLVLQDPRFSLNPVLSIGEQIAECFRIHRGASHPAARAMARESLAAVRLDDPRVYGLYPHQVSGGMGQRAMIAMMLAGDPDLLIADEPTSALDASAALQVLAVLDDLVRRRGMGLILISHDLDLVQGFCDRVLVLESGAIVERCAAADLALSRHPYTRRLLAARPRLEDAP